MDDSEIRKLAEAVEAGLRDGRTLESLMNALEESGYEQEDIKAVIGNVDRKNIIRRPQRKAGYDRGWVAAAVVIIIVIGFGMYVFLGQPPAEAKEPPAKEEPKEEVIRVCYALNESIMEMMKDAGADCDKWFLIKEV